MYYSVLWSSHKIGWMEGILGQPLPKYMLSHNIRLQEVFEIIANETAKVLHMLARPQTKMQCHLLKFIGFRLFTYLWRSCGKFNLSYSCLEIDDARWNEGSCSYPTQTWNGWNPNSLFRGWSSTWVIQVLCKCPAFKWGACGSIHLKSFTGEIEIEVLRFIGQPF